jgi:hypothetical protein
MLAVAVVLVVLAELAVRGLEPALPAPEVWPDSATATKAAQLELRSARGCTDVVFLGSSMSRDDFVPDVFTEADPARRSAYNASLDAASPSLLLPWVRDHVLPATSPATVVVGMASFDLNDAAVTPAAARRAYGQAPYTAPGAAGELEAAFTRNLALVRHRSALRDPETVADSVGDRLAGRRAARPDADGIDGVLADDGHGISRRDLVYEGDPGGVERLRRQFLRPFQIGGEQAAALREMVGTIERSGAEVVVALLPVTSDYVDAHPDDEADIREFRRALVSALAGTSAVVVEAPPAPPGSFADTHHLNGEGADALSAGLPALLDAAGAATRSCQGAPPS